MANVNLDALIPREDFEVKGAEDVQTPISASVKVNELAAGGFFYSALRKPDFQRETTEWDPKRVAGLVKTFLDGDLIPSVILWKNKDLVFVVDGSHRLSALIAWVQNDYGDGPRSMVFFNNEIPEDQKVVAQRTREMVEKEIGSYTAHLDAAKEPEKHSPEMVKRARNLGTLSLSLQWVQGDSAKAEQSFVRINQQGTKISPEELELIQKRRHPNVIAARAIIRRATGHQYWSGFSVRVQDEIKELASQVYALIFEPQPRPARRDSDLSAGGSVYSGDALRMVYEFVNICIETPSAKVDDDGRATVEYLKRCLRVMQLMLSTSPASLGLHPAVYFYTWNGRQQPVQFLVFASIAIDLEKRKKLVEFTCIRGAFEQYLIENRGILQQVVRRHGRKSDRFDAMLSYFQTVVSALEAGVKTEGVVAHLMLSDYSYLQPMEAPHGAGGADEFTTRVKGGTILRELTRASVRCPICNGLVPIQAMSLDHKVRVADGGHSKASNAQVTHPYCNHSREAIIKMKAKRGV